MAEVGAINLNSSLQTDAQGFALPRCYHCSFPSREGQIVEIYSSPRFLCMQCSQEKLKLWWPKELNPRSREIGDFNKASILRKYPTSLATVSPRPNAHTQQASKDCQIPPVSPATDLFTFFPAKQTAVSQSRQLTEVENSCDVFQTWENEHYSSDLSSSTGVRSSEDGFVSHRLNRYENLYTCTPKNDGLCGRNSWNYHQSVDMNDIFFPKHYGSNISAAPFKDYTRRGNDIRVGSLSPSSQSSESTDYSSLAEEIRMMELTQLSKSVPPDFTQTRKGVDVLGDQAFSVLDHLNKVMRYPAVTSAVFNPVPMCEAHNINVSCTSGTDGEQNILLRIDLLQCGMEMIRKSVSNFVFEIFPHSSYGGDVLSKEKQIVCMLEGILELSLKKYFYNTLESFRALRQLTRRQSVHYSERCNLSGCFSFHKAVTLYHEMQYTYEAYKIVERFCSSVPHKYVSLMKQYGPMILSRVFSASDLKVDNFHFEVSSITDRFSPTNLKAFLPRGSNNHMRTEYKTIPTSEIRSMVYSLRTIKFDELEPAIKHPWGLCCDKDGNVLVTDRLLHKVVVLSREGKIISTFGDYGESDGEFNRPCGIALRDDGVIYVVDKDNHRVQAFDSCYKFLFAFGSAGAEPGHFNHPWDIALDRKDKLAVSDPRNQRVQIFTHSGELLQVIVNNDRHVLKAPRGLLFHSEHELYVTDFNDHSLLLIDLKKYNENAKKDVLVKLPDSRANRRNKMLNRPQGICKDSSGNVLIADSKAFAVRLYSSGQRGCFPDDSGKSVRKWGNPPVSSFVKLQKPCNVKADNVHSILVLDYDGRAIFIFEK